MDCQTDFTGLKFELPKHGWLALVGTDSKGRRRQIFIFQALPHTANDDDETTKRMILFFNATPYNGKQSVVLLCPVFSEVGGETKSFFSQIVGRFSSDRRGLVHPLLSLLSSFPNKKKNHLPASICFPFYFSIFHHLFLFFEGTCDGGIFTYEKTTGHFLRTGMQEPLEMQV